MSVKDGDWGGFFRHVGILLVPIWLGLTGVAIAGGWWIGHPSHALLVGVAAGISLIGTIATVVAAGMSDRPVLGGLLAGLPFNLGFTYVVVGGSNADIAGRSDPPLMLLGVGLLAYAIAAFWMIGWNADMSMYAAGSAEVRRGDRQQIPVRGLYAFGAVGLVLAGVAVYPVVRWNHHHPLPGTHAEEAAKRAAACPGPAPALGMTVFNDDTCTVSVQLSASSQWHINDDEDGFLSLWDTPTTTTSIDVESLDVAEAQQFLGEDLRTAYEGGTKDTRVTTYEHGSDTVGTSYLTYVGRRDGLTDVYALRTQGGDGLLLRISIFNDGKDALPRVRSIIRTIGWKPA